MNSAIIFILCLFGFVALYVIYQMIINRQNPIAYFKTDAGKRILSGIVAAGALMLLLAALGLAGGCSGKYFNDATAYAGIDQTKEISPQCISGGIDTKGTSNLGAKVNLFESDDQRFRTNVKYTHHSCAVSEDRNTYDAAGIEFEYKFWKRPK